RPVPGEAEQTRLLKPRVPVWRRCGGLGLLPVNAEKRRLHGVRKFLVLGKAAAGTAAVAAAEVAKNSRFRQAAQARCVLWLLGQARRLRRRRYGRVAATAGDSEAGAGCENGLRPCTRLGAGTERLGTVLRVLQFFERERR